MDRYANIRRGLVGAWCPSLTYGGSTLADLSGRRRTGTITSPNWNASESGISQLAGGWTGQNAFMTATPNATFGVEATLSVWVKRRTATPASDAGPFGGGSTGIFCCDSATGASPASHYPWTDGTAYISTFRTARINSIALSANVDRTRWHLVTVTTDGNRWRFYQNAILVSDQAAQTTVSITAANFAIGRSFGASTFYYLDGNWDDARLYNRALTRDEIATLASRRGIGLIRERSRRLSVPSAPTTQFHIKVGGVWKPATTWIKVGGTWKTATPKINVSGTWK